MIGRLRLDEQKAACKEWPVTPVDRKFLNPVKSDVPTLILVGEFDPVTPPRNAYAIAASLDHSLVLVFKNAGHGIVADCLTSTLETFWESADIGAVDQSCGKNLPRPPFATSAR